MYILAVLSSYATIVAMATTLLTGPGVHVLYIQTLSIIVFIVNIHLDWY